MDQLERIKLEFEYHRYAAECECGMRTVLARLENLRQEMELSDENSPFMAIESRTKEFQSALDKLNRKNEPKTMESIRKMHDIVGIRVIVPFLDDIYRVRDAIMRQPSMKVEITKDYVVQPKDTGYRSLHLLVKMQVYFMETTKEIPVEIQIRTKAMDLWASMEHLLRYKNSSPSEQADAEFARIADLLKDFDERAMKLRDDGKESGGESSGEDAQEPSLSIQIEDSE